MNELVICSQLCIMNWLNSDFWNTANLSSPVPFKMYILSPFLTIILVEKPKKSFEDMWISVVSCVIIHFVFITCSDQRLCIPHSKSRKQKDFIFEFYL